MDINAFRNLIESPKRDIPNQRENRSIKKITTIETLHLYGNYLNEELQQTLANMYKNIQNLHTSSSSIVLCLCENGSAAFGDNCPSNGETKCTKCDPGYSLESGICRENLCECQFGFSGQYCEQAAESFVLVLSLWGIVALALISSTSLFIYKCLKNDPSFSQINDSE